MRMGDIGRLHRAPIPIVPKFGRAHTTAILRRLDVSQDDLHLHLQSCKEGFKVAVMESPPSAAFAAMTGSGGSNRSIHALLHAASALVFLEQLAQQQLRSNRPPVSVSPFMVGSPWQLTEGAEQDRSLHTWRVSQKVFLEMNAQVPSSRVPTSGLESLPALLAALVKRLAHCTAACWTMARLLSTTGLMIGLTIILPCSTGAGSANYERTYPARIGPITMEAQSFYAEFRARNEAGGFGHSYVVLGTIDATGGTGVTVVAGFMPKSADDDYWGQFGIPVTGLVGGMRSDFIQRPDVRFRIAISKTSYLSTRDQGKQSASDLDNI